MIIKEKIKLKIKDISTLQNNTSMHMLKTPLLEESNDFDELTYKNENRENNLEYWETIIHFLRQIQALNENNIFNTLNHTKIKNNLFMTLNNNVNVIGNMVSSSQVEKSIKDKLIHFDGYSDNTRVEKVIAEINNEIKKKR